MITGRISIPLAAMAMVLGLSACQAPPYQDGYVQPARYAARTCDPGRYASPVPCYQRADRPVYRSYRSSERYSPDCRPPVRYALPMRDRDYGSAYRPYRYAGTPRGCPPAYERSRSYRYVAERSSCGPRYRSSYRRYVPRTYGSDRPTRYRSTDRRYRDSSCCYW